MEAPNLEEAAKAKLDEAKAALDAANATLAAAEEKEKPEPKKNPYSFDFGDRYKVVRNETPSQKTTSQPSYNTKKDDNIPDDEDEEFLKLLSEITKTKNN